MMTNKKFFTALFNRVIGAVTAFVMILAAAAMPTDNANAAQVTQNELKDMANELCFMVNELRAEYGLNPIYVVPYLNDTSMTRAREITQNFDHKRPDGSRFSTIVDDNLIPYGVIFENIAAGHSSPEATMGQWKDSEKHFQVMLDPKITHMGMGCAYEQNSDYGWYWAQTFVICSEDLPGQYIPSRHTITPEADGDLTGDGVIDTYDYVALTDYLYKKANDVPVYFNDAQLAAADCFRDGIITESDAKVIMRYILGEYKSLPFIF
ncbi:MAG: SCP-like extracellular [Ruminococcus sp.]|nr:SCP-like extracellular [Ruminococcus sp.]